MKVYRNRNVKLPRRSTSGSAGYDFFVPNDYNEMHLPPYARVKIPSGIFVKIPQATALVAFNKSGIATKHGLSVGAQVIDQDYTGEIHLSVINTSMEYVKIEPGMALVQFLLLDVYTPDMEEVETHEDLYAGVETERGSAGFGEMTEKMEV